MARFGAALLVAVLYLIGSLVFTEFASVFEFDPDEGYNLGKVMSLRAGHVFLREIWSDQPPLFSYLLLAVFKLFGPSMVAARTVVLCLSAALVFFTYDSVVKLHREGMSRWVAHFAASMAVLLLLTSTGFAVWRVSVMIGLPCVTLAAGAAWAASEAMRQGEGSRTERGWIVASGVLLGLSVGIKLITLILAPVLIVTLAMARSTAPWSARLRGGWSRGLWWMGAFGITVLVALAPALLSGAAEELYLVHAAARSTYRSKHTVVGFVERDPVLFALAATSVALLPLGRGSRSLPWLGWLLFGLAALWRHQPLWLHHVQLLIAPAVVLAGAAIQGVWAALARIGGRPVGLGAALVLALTVAWSSAERMPSLLRPALRDQGAQWRLLDRLRPLYRGGYVATDRQILAFYLGAPVPPALAVTSAKRMRSGQLGARDIAAQIEQSEADLVILNRWSKRLRRQLRRALATRYELVVQDASARGLEVYRRRAPRP